MTTEYNCQHAKRHAGQACAGCLAVAYDLLDRAFRIIRETFPNSAWLVDAKPVLFRRFQRNENEMSCPICGVLECPCGCFDGDDEGDEIEDGVR